MAQAARVLLAMSSPLVRVRLRHVLLQDPSIILVGEATDGPQAAQVTLDRAPQIILCDERILADPSIEALFSPRMGKVNYRVVVVAANARTVNRAGPVPVVAVLPIDLPGEEMGGELQLALRVDVDHSDPPLAPRRVAGMEHRFVSADNFQTDDPMPGDKKTELLQRMPPQPGKRTPTQGMPTQGLSRTPGSGLTHLSTAGLTLRTTRLGGVSRRNQDAAQDRLSSLLRAIQSEQVLQRDVVTGLANTKALGNALRVLPTVGHPAAVVVVDLWYAPGTSVPSDSRIQEGILRSAGAALRANTRQEDMVCRLDGMTFAIVMPGLDGGTAPTPLGRLREAMDRLRPATEERPYALSVALGVGLWEPGMPAALPLERAWRAMVAERDANRG